ncbi:MAG: PAAR-like domain-containing protein [Desulfatitalea sp.]
MGNDVFANGREIACKAADGKALCAFPDVAFTPPQTPATPPGVPIPYPNTAFAKDTTKGSKKVKISGKEIMLKNQSYFKTSTGDEAGAAPKKGILTSKTKGKVYFNAWSMDVKFEGQNVVRHLDLTTHNHGSFPANEGVPWPYLDSMAVEPGGACAKEAEQEKKACEDFDPHGSEDLCESLKPLPYDPSPRYAKTGKPSGSTASPQAHALSKHHAAEECMNARRCFLQPYKPKSGIKGCCSPQTPHHLIEASALFDEGRGGPGSKPLAGVNTGSVPYNEDDAPCVCAEGINQNTGTHGLMHTFQSSEAMKMPIETLNLRDGGSVSGHRAQTYKQGKKNAVSAMTKAFPASFCSQACTEKQLDNYHNQCGINDETKIKAVVEGKTSPEDLRIAEERAKECAKSAWDSYMAENYAEGLAEMVGIPKLF